MTGLNDSHNRPIDYLRISVTDRCTLRCVYCMPSEGVPTIPHHEILSYEEIHMVAEAAAALGINKMRLTGGEPLARAHVSNLVGLLTSIEGIDDVSLTTNGMLLGKFAGELKAAGLNRVNISLDSLQPERFKKITRIGELNDTLAGISAAERAGLHPIKINMVVMKGINDTEIVDFARKTIKEGWHVRYIEFMPVGEEGQEWSGQFMPISEITERIETLGKLEPHSLNGNGPARYFRLPNAGGTIGFISPVSEHFCFNCNRLRLTAEGKMRACLLSDDEINLRDPIREGCSIDELKVLISKATDGKPKGHKLTTGKTAKERTMSQIGG